MWPWCPSVNSQEIGRRPCGCDGCHGCDGCGATATSRGHEIVAVDGRGWPLMAMGATATTARRLWWLWWLLHSHPQPRPTAAWLAAVDGCGWLWVAVAALIERPSVPQPRGCSQPPTPRLISRPVCPTATGRANMPRDIPSGTAAARRPPTTAACESHHSVMAPSDIRSQSVHSWPPAPHRLGPSLGSPQWGLPVVDSVEQRAEVW